MIKPVYAIPSMKEIKKRKKSNLSLVSTFSGCGGSCLGFKMAGFNVLWANEFIESAQETYEANHKEVILNKKDIRKITAEEILKTINKKKFELDVLEGSPPCASFSVAGKRNKKWGKETAYSDSKQRSDDLFFEYIRILRGLMPKVFVAENVTGLVKGVAKGYFKKIFIEMQESGYIVKSKILDASWLGVPQSRQRIIFIGVREDLKKEPIFPLPLKYRYSIKEVMPEDIGDKQVADMSKYATGKEWEKLRLGEQSKKYFQLVRSDPFKPAQTVTATAGNVGAASITHPYENRKFTVNEIKRLCSFPDDFILCGNYQQQVERMGRSVPPLMMKAIAETIKRKIL